MTIANHRSIFAGVVMLAALGFQPAQGDDVPTVQIMSCIKDCGTFVGATPDNSHNGGGFPLFLSNDGTYIEGSVILSFTISADGHPKPPIVVQQLVGPQAFADRAIAAVTNWTYHPATRNGVPVEQSNYRAQIQYVSANSDKGGRAEVVVHYAKAEDLAKNNKLAEAIALLRSDLAKPKLNFYERTMIANALSLYYLRSGDNANALDQVRDATMGSGKFLSTTARSQALHNRILLEAEAGQYSEALAWFDILKKATSLEDDDPSIEIARKIRAFLAGTGEVAMLATIVEGKTLWDHALLRRKFGFADTKGSLDHFDLRCDQQQIRSQISETAEWTVPDKFSNCRITVTGTSGTTFKFLELTH